MKKWTSLLACSGLVACAATPGPDAPRPASSAAISVPVAPPPTGIAPQPGPLRVQIGSRFEVDPQEPLPAGAVARCGTTRMRAASPSAVAVSNTGSVWAVDHVVSPGWVLRDVTRGADVAVLPGGPSAVFAPDASFVAVASVQERDLVVFYSTPKGERLGEVKIPPTPKSGPHGLWRDGGHIERLVMSPDGAAIVVTTEGNESAHLVDTTSHKLVRTVRLPEKSRLVGVSRGGDRALLESTAQEGGSGGGFGELTGLFVLDLRRGTTLRKETFKRPPPDPDDPGTPRTPEHGHAAFRISPDGTKLYRSEHDSLAVIDLTTGKESALVRPAGAAPGTAPGAPMFSAGTPNAAWTRGGRFEIFGDGRAIWDEDILDLTDGSVDRHVGLGFEAVSANGKYVLSRDGRRFVLSPEETPPRDGHDSPVSSLAFLPDNQLVAVASLATFWNSASCTWMATPSLKADRVVTAQRGAITVVSGVSPVLLNGDQEPRRIQIDGLVRLLALAPGGETLYVGQDGSSDGEGTLLTRGLTAGPDSAGRERTLPLPLRSIAASPDGHLVAVSAGKTYGSERGELHLLFPESLATKVSVQVNQAGTVAFVGPDRLLHAPFEEGIRVHALPELDEVSRLHHGGCCRETAASPDGKRIAGSMERGFVIWEVATRRLVAEVRQAHRQAISSLAFSADSRVLATGSSDTTVLLWDIEKLSAPALPGTAETKLSGAAAAKSFFERTSAFFEIKPDGTLAARALRVKLSLKPPALKAVTRVVSGRGCHCAIAEGKVRCWGSTYDGALGIPERKGKAGGSAAELTTPSTVAVKDPIDLRMAGTYACALERGGDLICWGRIDDKGPPLAPGKVLGGVKSFALGQQGVCAAGTDAAVRCWGYGHPAPQPLAVKDAVAVGLGSAHTCVLQKGGTVQCTGKNDVDQLGDDTGLDRAGMVQVQGVQGAVALFTEAYSTCALTGSQAVFCWGGLGDAHLARATHLAALDGATAVQTDRDTGAVCGLRGDRVDCVKLGARPE